MRAITIEREDALDALALDRMRNARKAVKEVKDIESVANEALRQILDINTPKRGFDDAGASENIQNRKAKKTNDDINNSMNEQNLLKLSTTRNATKPHRERRRSKRTRAPVKCSISQNSPQQCINTPSTKRLCARCVTNPSTQLNKRNIRTVKT